MFRAMRKMMWATVAAGLAFGGWSLWKLRASNDEVSDGGWSPIPNPATTGGAGSGATAKGGASPGGANGSSPSGATPKSSETTAPKQAAKNTGVAPATAASTTGSATTATNGTATSTAPKSAAPQGFSATGDAADTPSAKAASKTAAKSGGASDSGAWVEPAANGSCPAEFPIKANNGSKIYHLPEGGSYRRTKAERCYADPADAEADGYRASKR